LSHLTRLAECFNVSVPLNIAEGPEGLFSGCRIVIFPQKPQALDAVLVHQAVDPFHDDI
jgi:hypothetical protein